VADYIDRNILSQAYVHIEEPPLDATGLADLKRNLEAYIFSRGRFFLYEEVRTDVVIKEGSLKLYLTIAGALYIAIGNYGDFRGGVDFLYQDAKRLADCAVSESLFLTKSRHKETIRSEARVGVVGSLKSAIDRLEKIQADAGEVSLSTTNRKIGEVKESIEQLLANLNDPADPPFVANGLCGLVKKLLSAKPKAPKRSPHTEDQVAEYRRQRQELISMLTKKAKSNPRNAKDSAS
jgi:hypothetical protein